MSECSSDGPIYYTDYHDGGYSYPFNEDYETCGIYSRSNLTKDDVSPSGKKPGDKLTGSEIVFGVLFCIFLILIGMFIGLVIKSYLP